MKRGLDETGRTPGDRPQEPAYETFPDVTPRKIGGDDSLEHSLPTDHRSDEKVIRQDRSQPEGAPYQPVENRNEDFGKDDDTSDDHDTKDSF